MESQHKELSMKRDELEREMLKLQEEGEEKTKTEIKRTKLKFVDEIYHLNSLVRRIGLSIDDVANLRVLPDDHDDNFMGLIEIIKDNLNGVNKLIEQKVEAEKEKLGQSMKDFEKNCNSVSRSDLN